MARFRQSLPAISALYFQRTAPWLNTFFFLVSGISIGVFTELVLPEEEKVRLAAYLMENLFTDSSVTDHSAVFLQSAGSHIFLLFLIFLSGLTKLGAPAAYGSVAYQGIALGFSSALLMESMKFRGALAVTTAILPPNVLILPALFLSSASAINTIRDRRIRDRRKKSLSFEAGPYCFCFLLPLILILTAAVLETFISPALLQLIRSR